MCRVVLFYQEESEEEVETDGVGDGEGQSESANFQSAVLSTNSGPDPDVPFIALNNNVEERNGHENTWGDGNESSENNSDHDDGEEEQETPRRCYDHHPCDGHSGKYHWGDYYTYPDNRDMGISSNIAGAVGYLAILSEEEREHLPHDHVGREK